MSRTLITEELGIHKEWFVRAGEVKSIDEAAAFAKSLMEDYRHDYGTICHALTAGAVAMCWAMDRHPEGGITGFQGGCVMWGFITQWDIQYRDKPLRLLNFGDMLFPQHTDKFAHTISSETWKWLQEQAQAKLRDESTRSEAVAAHWQSIVDGQIPFGYAVVG